MNAAPPLRWSWLAAAGLAVSAVAACAAALSGFGYRWEWWTFRQGFTVLRWSGWAGAAGAGVALAGGLFALVRRDRRALCWALAGLAAGLTLAGWTWNLLRTAKSVPPIHDITTDFEQPPTFSAVVPLRRGAANSLEYGGPEVASLQAAAYPDIRPLILAIPPEQAFDRALDAVHRLRWLPVREDRQAGRIEAFDRTFWYGFIDDVVIRISPEGSGSRVDVRSVSRVGRGDLGVNAKRIRRLFAQMARG